MCEEVFSGVRLGYMAMPRAVDSLSDYIFEVDETTLLLHVARGLTCLHSHGLVHGDIKVRSAEGRQRALGVLASSFDEGPILILTRVGRASAAVSPQDGNVLVFGGPDDAIFKVSDLGNCRLIDQDDLTAPG